MARAPSCFDVKGARRLSPPQLAALQALLEVREAEAAERDRGAVLEIFEDVFDHRSFTGRSGTMSQGSPYSVMASFTCFLLV